MKRIAHLVLNELGSSIFDAMVLNRLAALKTRGHDTHLIATVPMRRFLRRRARRTLRTQLDRYRRVLCRSVHVVPTAPSRFGQWWNDGIGVGLTLKRLVDASRPLVVQCRGSYAASVALNARRRFGLNYEIVNDLRGIQWAEKWYNSRPGESLSLSNVPADAIPCETAEAEVARSSDRVITVSHRMADYVINRFGVRPEKVTTLWNAVDLNLYDDALSRRDETRAGLGLAGKFVIAYCGSIYPRQRVPAALRLVERILERHSGVHFLVLTNNPRRMRDAFTLAALPKDRASIHCVAFQETPRFLCAADLGLITTGFFEAPHLANEVCCPVKFAEYLAAGLPVVMSDRIGDYSSYAQEHGVGVSISPNASLDVAARMVENLMRRIMIDGAGQRQRCRFFAKRDLDLATHMDNLVSILEHVQSPAHSRRDYS